MPAVLEQSLYNYLYNMIGQFSGRPIMLFYIERYIYWKFSGILPREFFYNSLYGGNLV